MKNKKRKDMTDQEFAKYWSGQLDFVQQSLSDEEIPENVKEILGEWLMDRAKEILPKDKDNNNE